jgi:hypothetical protein
MKPNQVIETWQTFVPERPLYKNSSGGLPTETSIFKRKQQPPPTTTEPVSVETKPTHSLQDDAWKSTQKAASRLIKRNTITPLPPPPPPPSVVPEAAAPEVRVKVEHVAKDQVVEIQPLEDVPRRDQDLELFAANMERRPLRPSTQLILTLPPPVETLQYCAQFKKSSMPWFVGGQKTIAENPDISPPRIPLYTRSYLLPFMREPDPQSTHERPCFNLDREPLEGEQGRLRCIAHRLSEQKLGEGRGYRLRELLTTDQCTQINAALSHRNGPDPCKYLSSIPEMCVMCHVWMTTEAVLDQKDRVEEHAIDRKTTPPKQVTVFNRFMVDIDKPGEYSRSCLLAGDAVSMGIWGPFPLWNERHYVLWTDPKGTGLRGFQELEDMLFRLSLDPSQQQQSTRTLVTAAASNSPH